MPELPDLVYLERRLAPLLAGARVEAVQVKQPVIIRNHTGVPFDSAPVGAVVAAVLRHGPFLCFALCEPTGAARCDLVIHPMLAGRFAWESGTASIKKMGLCFSLRFTAGTLHYLDTKKMGKVYLLPPGRFDLVPRYTEQGVDILGPGFTREYFRERFDKSRTQVRVFIMNQTILSAIGNAYADEILFVAGIHPKTFCYQVPEEGRDRLFEAIRSVLSWGIEMVAAADPALEDKVRGHLRVRGRKDQPCPVCGTKIRRVAVLGFDAFFCPTCQPPGRELFIDWRKK